jgi:hypothetical protein
MLAEQFFGGIKGNRFQFAVQRQAKELMPLHHQNWRLGEENPVCS